MAEHRTGVPRNEQMTGFGSTASSSYVPSFDSMGYIEPTSLHVAKYKEINEKFGAQRFNKQSGITVKRWGAIDGQEFEKAVKTSMSMAELEKEAIDIINGTAGTAGAPGPIMPDQECCAWLDIQAPTRVESGSTSGVSALGWRSGARGCVFYWSIEGCNPITWGCGELRAAGTGGSGAGLHQTSKGMVFIAPTIGTSGQDCYISVDTKIKVAVLTADGKKQVAASVGTDGWHGYGMGPGDELYDLFGPDEVCSETANITTEKTIDCPPPDDCSNVRIGFVSNTMGTNEYQGLVALNATSDMDIRWENSGGGSISGNGVHIIYGSPPSNWNCEENGYIKLFCNNRLVDSLKISTTIFVNVYPALSVYKYYCDLDIYSGQETFVGCRSVSNYIEHSSYCQAGGIYCNSGCCMTVYDCAGGIMQRGIMAYGIYWNPLAHTCHSIQQYTQCVTEGDGFILDFRSMYYQDQACCPPEL